MQAFREADCVAVVTRSGRRMWDAEQTALHQARLCLAWLATRGRFGHATDAYGAATRFERRVSRTLPRIGRAVAVRGLRTRRRWILQPEEPTSRPALNAGDARQLLRPPLPEELSQSTDMAMRRAMRAFAGDPAERVVALFEAWEFYSAAVPPNRAFSPDDLRRLREELPGCLPTWVQPDQAQRVVDLLDLANGQSFRHKRDAMLRQDGVPLSAEELRVLGRLRKARNELAHGAQTTALLPGDLDWGCSILSRALVYRVLREGAAKARTG